MQQILDRFEAAAIAEGFLVEEQKDWPGSLDWIEKRKNNKKVPIGYQYLEITPQKVAQLFAQKGYNPSKNYLSVLERWRGLGLRREGELHPTLFRSYPLHDFNEVIERGDMYRGFFSEDWWEGRDPEPYRAMLHIMDGNLGGLVTDAKDGSDGPLFNFDEQDHYGEEEPAVFHSLREMFTCLTIALEEGIDIRAGYGPEEREDAHRFAKLCLKLLGDRPYWQSAEAFFAKPRRSSFDS